MSESFWNFSIRTYRNEAVAAACLELQDRHGVDVNMLLFSIWFGITRGSIDDGTLDRALGFSEDWAEHVVRPLRSVRTWMKSQGCESALVDMTSCMDYREKVKSIELTGEKIQQEGLQALAASAEEIKQAAAEKIESIVDNVSSYLLRIQVKCDVMVREHLQVIIDAAADDLSAAEIRAALEKSG